VRRLLVVSTVALCGLPTALAADDRPPKSPWDLKLFRFEFDNDTFIGSDDAFTAGWSFQVHSRLMDQWNPAYAGWIGKLPGLGDDGQGRRVVRWAGGSISTWSDVMPESPTWRRPREARPRTAATIRPWIRTRGISRRSSVCI
jgi:hypothetical protein